FVDPKVPFEESIETLAALRAEGKIAHVGLSNVTVGQLDAASRIVPVASVQNRYSLGDRSSDALVDRCTAEGIAFIAYAPLGAHPFEREAPLTRAGGALDRVARRHGAAPGQVALAWLLARSPAILPIFGTRSTAHLEADLAAVRVTLGPEDIRDLDELAAGKA